MFILDKPTAATETYIYLLTSCDDGRLKLSLKLKIHPDNWNKESERPIIPKDGKGKAVLITLNRIYEKVEKLRDDCLIYEQPFTTSKVTAAVKEILGVKVAKHQKCRFEDAIDIIKVKMKTGELLTDKEKVYAPGTIKNYGKVAGKLLEFAKEKDISVEFHDITMDTYCAFKAWCYSKNWTINFTGSLIKDWKGVLKAGFRLGLHKNKIYDHKDFKKIAEETDDVYLDENELKLIKEVDLSNNNDWDRARDWFLIGCYSGLRASDLTLLRDSKITRNEIILATEKTDEKVVIPIHPISQQIFRKYKGLPPKMHQNQINEYIKFVARKAKIRSTFLYSVTEGGKRRDYYLEKWQMVSTHTARRSCITNMGIAGVPDTIIMKLTGIKSPATLARYKKLTQNEAAKIAAKHSFFN